jgi:serine/threonine protein kinase
VQDVPDAEQAVVLRELLALELEYRFASGKRPSVQEYQARFPEQAALVQFIFGRALSAAGRLAGPKEPAAGAVETPGPTGPYRGSPPGDSPSTVQENPPAVPENQPPVVIGDYELREKIGEGGMGVVYRAHQRNADRTVAVKVIRPDRLERLTPEQRQEWLARFKTEAQTAACLEHNHIVTVYEVGEIEGQHFYSMRYVDGQSLADILKAGPIPNQRAAAYLKPVAEAVHYAHCSGILHRDLKPKNILVGTNDQPYVADFGLAKWLEDAESLTQPGAWLGSPPYLSPEQAQDAKNTTPTSDVYSLGATLYELLTGQPPFRAPTILETLHQVMHKAPVPPRQINPVVDRDLEIITLKCLQKIPAWRYPTAAALADDLRRYLNGEPIQARAVGPGERLWRWYHRNLAVANLAGAVAVLLTLVVVGLRAANLQSDEKARLQEVTSELHKKLKDSESKPPVVIKQVSADSTPPQRAMAPTGYNGYPSNTGIGARMDPYERYLLTRGRYRYPWQLNQLNSFGGISSIPGVWTPEPMIPGYGYDPIMGMRMGAYSPFGNLGFSNPYSHLGYPGVYPGYNPYSGPAGYNPYSLGGRGW